MLENVSAPLWEQHARQWAHIRGPLRPSVEDVRVAQRVVDNWCAAHDRPPRALVLGSTIEFASLDWPADSRILALDRSFAMLQRVWREMTRADAHRPAIAGHWLEMPLADRCCDILFGDASTTQFRKAEVPPLFRAVRRLMRDDAVALLRVFTRPASAETADAVWTDLSAGAIANFHGFKLRLLMALADREGEVHPRDVWMHVLTRAGSLERLACEAGWNFDEVATITAYRDHLGVYWFPTLTEIRDLLAVDFVEQDCYRPTYEMGACCPTFLLAPRS